MPNDTTRDDAIPTPSWQRVPHRAGSRRRDPLTQEAIVDAGLRLLDAEGLDGFSMRRVAKELDTGAASLYWHVGSKDGLLDLIFDRIIGEHEVPDPDPERWQEQLKDVARSMRATILRHRDVIQVSIGRIPMGPNALVFNERFQAIVRSAGLPGDLAVASELLMFSVVNGYTIDETGVGGEQPTDAPPSDEEGTMVRDYLASLPADRFPHLTAHADEFALIDRDAMFELLIDLYVDGLAKRAREA